MKVFTRDQVRENGYSIIGPYIYDFKNYSGHHRGGRFLHLFEGKNIGLSFHGAHHKSESAGRLLKNMKLGRLQQDQLTEEEKEIDKLFKKYKKQGLFKLSPFSLVLDICFCLLLYILGLFLQNTSPTLSFLFLTLGILRSAWIIHDAGHFAILASEKKNRLLMETLGMIFLGSSQVDYHTIDHRIHHGLTNTINFDGATRVGSIKWNEKQVQEEGKIIPFKLQPFLWFFIILPLTFPALLVKTSLMRIAKGKYLSLFFLALRWILFYYILFNQNLALTFLPVFVAGYFLALTSSLNHFVMPMGMDIGDGVAKRIFKRTQNIKNYDPLTTWLTGGLNFHIEHHFFPSMPSKNLRLIQKDIRLIASKYGHQYQEERYLKSIQNLFLKAYNPIDNKDVSFNVEQQVKTI